MDKETLKQFLKQTAQSVCNFLKEFGKGTKNVAVAIHNDYSNAQQIKLNQIQQNNNIAIAYQIQQELFCVLQERQYPYLATINVLEDVMPFRPCPPQMKILLENRESRPLACVLRQVRDKINFDIQCSRQWILNNYTQQEAWMLYPNLMSGMYIAEIRADGIYAVLTIGFPQRK